MYKRIFVFMLLVTCAAGCGGSAGRGPGNGVMRDLVEHFRAGGIEAADVRTKAFGFIGAADGIGLTLDGVEVEIYLFDPQTARPEVAESVIKAQETGRFYCRTIRDEIPVEMNGNLMLYGLNGDGHPGSERIKEVFGSFGR